MNEELNLLKVWVLKLIRFQTALCARAVDVINSSSIVNKMPFTKEDKIVIKVLRQEKGYGTKKSCRGISRQKLVSVVFE